MAKVQNAAGTPIYDATVTYSIGDATEQPCDFRGSESGEYACGMNLPGLFTVTATRDSTAVSMTVDVLDGPCTVETQRVTLNLE